MYGDFKHSTFCHQIGYYTAVVGTGIAAVVGHHENYSLGVAGKLQARTQRRE